MKDSAKQTNGSAYLPGQVSEQTGSHGLTMLVSGLPGGWAERGI